MANAQPTIASEVFPRTAHTSDTLVQAAHFLGDNPILVVEWHTRQILACNDAVYRVFGYAAHELVGGTTRPLHLSDQAFDAFSVESERSIHEGTRSYLCRFRMRRRDGSEFPTENLVQVIRDSNDGVVGVISAVRDLTNSPEHEPQNPSSGVDEALPLTMNVPGATFQRVRYPDGTSTYTYIAGRLIDEHGIDPARARADPATVLDLMNATDRDAFEAALDSSARSLSGIDMVLRFLPTESSTVWLRVISQPHRLDDGSTVWNGLAIDVTREKRAEEEAHWLATHDSLTGLVNREAFTREVDHTLAVADAHHRHIAIAQLGVRDMVAINESYGFDAGDQVLREVGRRLAAALLPDDLVARAHGDIFLVMLDIAETSGDLETAIRRLRSACQHSIDVGEGAFVDTDLTIGVARFPEDGRSSEELLRAAALAARRAHADRAVEYDFYASDLSDQIRQRFELDRMLREAIARGHLEPYFQPQVSLVDRSLIGFEALIRWPRGDTTLTPPAQFIPIAEQNGLIGALGRLMLAKVAEQIREWKAAGLDVPPIAVNCSAKHFREGALTEDYDAEVLQRGLPCASVSLELTESTLLEDYATAKQAMTTLTNRGVRLSLDDFGTGFSSLGYLTQLPFDEMKIDRQFTASVESDERQRSIVHSLFHLSGALKLSTVAEGIETHDQEEIMQRLGCQAGQGYLYSTALPASQARGWLEAYR